MLLGTFQKQWLKETLRSSEATFKVIASSVPFSEGIKPGSKDPWDGYPEEHMLMEEIFSFIEKEKIEGVAANHLIRSADRHRIDFRKISRPKGYDFLEFVSWKDYQQTCPFQLSKQMVWFGDTTRLVDIAYLNFNTTKKNPEMKFEAYDNSGKLLFASKSFGY